MNYVLRRLISAILILVIVSLITFAIFQIIPGDPVLAKLGLDADEAQVEALRHELGLDRPVYVRYFEWITGAVQGDLGTSIRFDAPVFNLIKGRLGVTASLTLLSLILIVGIGLPVGVFIAKRESLAALVVSIISQIGMAIPSFFLGILITFLFGLVFRMFVPGRYVSFAENWQAAMWYLFFAALAIAIPRIAVIIRYMRSSILEEKKQDYVRSALAKGGSNNYIMVVHILRNALIPVITVLGMTIADVLGGSLIVEQVFNIPGIGRLLIMGITNRDFPLVQGIVLYIAVIIILINFTVDVVYRVIDPRIKLS